MARVMALGAALRPGKCIIKMRDTDRLASCAVTALTGCGAGEDPFEGGVEGPSEGRRGGGGAAGGVGQGEGDLKGSRDLQEPESEDEKVEDKDFLNFSSRRRV